MKTTHGHFYGLCDILFSKHTEFVWDFLTFAADNTGTDEEAARMDMAFQVQKEIFNLFESSKIKG